MRFSSPSDSQTFINSLKEGLKDVRNLGRTNSKFGPEMTSPYEHFFMKTTHERTVEILSNVDPGGNYEPVLQLIAYQTKSLCAFISWISSSVESQIAMNLRPFETAAEMWNYLNRDRIYRIEDEARGFQLRNDIHEYAQGDKSI
ncbi:hypothetical protein GH714_009317 [Hevea brasiliensis]|uniref:Retrotransposon gag domain-containing protein n=1 Tax=Hevea brasiliensis TaxID=3981 RepID=A0A6A6LKF7_HEVBR|nr:hypothetical protein GH714_009317 [Hevea brasiliensis]